MGGVGSWLGRGLLVIAVLLMVLVGVSAGAVPVQRSAAAAPAPAPLVLRVMPLGASSTAGNGSPETAGYRVKGVSEDTPCRFAVNPATAEHVSPSRPLCRAYHTDRRAWGPTPRRPRT